MNLYQQAYEHHKKGQFWEAFCLFTQANHEQMKAPFNVPLANEYIERIKALQLPINTGPDQGEDLVFVVGLPRSGTTLLDRIINAHPQGYGAGERRGMVTLLDHYLHDKSPMSPEKATEFYRKAEKLPLGKICVDKMPRNMLGIPVIKAVFPKAKIVYIERDRFQTLFSIFTSDFAEYTPYKYTWETLNIYWHQNQSLVEHFQPFTIRYESLVINFDDELRRLLDFLELPFSNSCYNFYHDTRSVTTCSKEQVSQPLNTGGLDKWDPYKPFLLPE